jgi:integrase
MNIDQANSKLSRVKIRQKGQRLYLRATLPNRNGQGQKQTDIATGCPATEQGLKLALAKAQALEADILLERFTWDGLENKGQASHKTIEQWCNEMEQAHWQAKQRTPNREKCFYNDYGIAFRQLPPDEPLTVEVLKRVLLRTEAHTRSRERNHNAYSRLAKFAGIELPADWKALKGEYSPGDRRIPSDQEILETWERLPGSRWRWGFGMLAAYGLRNHEIVRLDLSQFPIVQVLKNTKTQDRVVYPLYPEWVERFNLKAFDPPRLTSDINSINGTAVCRAFQRNKIPFTPYALRDSYAVRGAVLGVNPAIMAKWMGHSLDTHYKHYLKWIEQKDFDAVWEGLGKNQGRREPDP